MFLYLAQHKVKEGLRCRIKICLALLWVRPVWLSYCWRRLFKFWTVPDGRRLSNLTLFRSFREGRWRGRLRSSGWQQVAGAAWPKAASSSQLGTRRMIDKPTSCKIEIDVVSRCSLYTSALWPHEDAAGLCPGNPSSCGAFRRKANQAELKAFNRARSDWKESRTKRRIDSSLFCLHSPPASYPCFLSI